VTTHTTVERNATLLNQVIAVRTGVKTDTDQALTKAYHLLQRKELMTGLARTYQPHDEDGFRYPAEQSQPQVKAEEVLRTLSLDLTRLFDITAAMDWSNQHARADVVLFGGEAPVVLMRDVPVSYLMFLEKALNNLETLVRKLPTLDPTEEWTFDPATDYFRSTAVGTVKTKKVRRNHVLAQATDRHPAQVESYSEDEPIGVWSTVKFSAALPAQRVNKMLARIKALTEAVKFAREQANMEEAMSPKPGKVVLDYVFAADTE
jgi:hypothetical protein